MNILRSKPKTVKAFSLMEMVVTMGILAIVITMLSNVLINSILISQRTIARSFIREEVVDIMDRIAYDLRNASSISACEGSLDTATCDLVIKERFTWRMCDPEDDGQMQVCKVDASGNILYASSPNLRFNRFTIEPGFETQTSSRQRNILITIVASHTNSNYAVNNVINQVAISSRNYLVR